MNTEIYWFLLAAFMALLGLYVSALHVSLRHFSPSKFRESFEDVEIGLQRMQILQRALWRLVTLTGVWRVGCTLCVFFALFEAMDNIALEQEHGKFWWHGIAVVLALVVVSFSQVVLGGTWSRYRRDIILVKSFYVLKMLDAVGAPFLWLMHWGEPLVRRLLGVHVGEVADISAQVKTVIEDSVDGVELDAEQREMLEAVFELSTQTADAVMTPRTDISGLEIEASLTETIAFILECGHSRIPVYKKSLDSICGILYAKDMIGHLQQELAHKDTDQSVFSLEELAREPYFIPGFKPVSELLRDFRAKHVHIAVVLDEYGGTAGLVSIEDVLEEIVGEIQDEFEEPEDAPPQCIEIEPRVYEVDARYDVADLFESLDIEASESVDYETVGGFALASLGRIPVNGEVFQANGYHFEIIEAEPTRVLRIKIRDL